MASIFFINGNARKALISDFAVNGKIALANGISAEKAYENGDLWGSVTIQFSNILAGSSILIIKSDGITVLANIPSATLDQQVTIDWFYPPDFNTIQFIITKPGYYFINTTIDLEYSSDTIFFLLDQVEVATIGPEDVAIAVWSEILTTYNTASSAGKTLKDVLTGILNIPTNPALDNDPRFNKLDATISSRLPSSGYTAPDNASISSIKLKTDQINFSGGNVDANAQIVSDKTGYFLDNTEINDIVSEVTSSIERAGGLLESKSSQVSVDSVKSDTGLIPATL